MNAFLCANETTITKLLEDLRGSCRLVFAFIVSLSRSISLCLSLSFLSLSSSDDALYCPTGSNMCLKWSQVCDGHMDCTDGKDESPELCAGSVCPPDSFRCQSGICIEKDKKCDTILDCFDGSDELRSICGIPESPENIPGDLLHPEDIDEPSHIGGGGGSLFWRYSGCEITEMPGLRISDFFSEYSYGSVVKVVPQLTVVNKGCDAGYRLLGSSVSICSQQNEWSSVLDSCVRECNQTSLMRHPKYTMQCRSNSNTLNDCKEKPIASSSIRLTCAPGYEATNGIDHVDYNCTESGDWAGYDRRLECQPICGLISKFHPDVKPWTVSIYHLEDSIFKFRCLGTIVSFDVVVTANGCFNDEYKPAEKYLHYAVVVGDHRVDFKLNEEHGYTVHTIANLHTVSAYVFPIPCHCSRLQRLISFSTIPNSQIIFKATILTLVKPLQLGAKVRPACLDLNQSNDLPVEIYGDFADKKVGTGITSVDNTGKHTLTYFVNDPKTSHSIAGFSEAISATIRKERVH